MEKGKGEGRSDVVKAEEESKSGESGDRGSSGNRG